jgi:hypothetical protein
VDHWALSSAPSTRPSQTVQSVKCILQQDRQRVIRAPTENQVQHSFLVRGAKVIGSAALFGILIGLPSCFKVTRNADDVKAIQLSASTASFAIATPCTIAAAQASIPIVAESFELEVEEASDEPGAPWIFLRGARLHDGPLYYRIDVVPTGGDRNNASLLIIAIPSSMGVSETQETIAKPGALAMRIVAACAAGGAQ